MALCSRSSLLVAVGALAFLYLGVAKVSELGVKDVVLLAGRFFLILALLSLLISVVTPWIESYSLTSSRSPPVNVPEHEMDQRRKLARQEQQEAQREKASLYMDSVLKPRQEVKLRNQEEHFFRMTGQSWKLTDGHRLGVNEETEDSDEDTTDESPNQEALKKRKLPENVTRPPPPIEPPKVKKLIVLPEEPSETEEGAVTIALRCPSGRVCRRRFLKTCNSNVLLEWMMKQGYHRDIYTLCTPYPRTPVEIEDGLTLEDIGINTDSVLIVDQIEP